LSWRPGDDDGSGRTWQEIGSAKGFSTIIAPDLFAPGSGVVLNEKGELFSTSDNGKTWKKNAIDFKVEPIIRVGYYPLAAVRFKDADTGLLVAYDVGERAWTVYAIAKAH